MDDFLFRGELADLDVDLMHLAQIEAERQFRRLILIPSESTSPLAVRELLASAFQNIYAEGYPRNATRQLTEEEILDYGRHLARYRRYSDPRYYKGVEYADTAEELARRRCAVAFAANAIRPEGIFVNVQPLSGAPANNAVYHALVKPGDRVMGMNLLHGGHLSHGSAVHRSGKLYQAVHYGVDPETERIDYDSVAALAREHRPKLIIAGFSSYPWSVNWHAFREIADSVDAYLLADIAHVAGLVVAGEYPSPVGIADVITFTTHKSLCGPRGAAILTTDRELARRLDRAVFPGEQGGPHMNTIIAQALTFKLATTDQFKALQRQIVANCKTLTQSLAEAGFRIPFGGTDTHLTNIDVSSIRGPDGTALSGDMAARILDVAGIVVNRNTIPGDTSAADPSGVRLGTPWITQRGFKEPQTRELAGLLAEVLHACKPYGMLSQGGLARRAKVDFEVLNQVKMRVRDLAERMGIDFEPASHGYPHYYYLDDPEPEGPFVEVEVQGEGAVDFLRFVTSGRPLEFEQGELIEISVAAPRGAVQGWLSKTEDSTRWRIVLAAKGAPEVLSWLRDLSDGYITVDPEDLHRKIPGPVVVRVTGSRSQAPEASARAEGGRKPWFLGIPAQEGEALPAFTWEEGEAQQGDLRRTALFETHHAMGARMVPFAGWEMPVWYSSVIEEHVATREAAGLFDVSHMGVYQVEGPQAAAFLDSVVGNDAAGLSVGESLYTQFLDPQAHVIDDTMIYRRGQERYMVVVNAANDEKDWAWLNAVRRGEVLVDNRRPWAQAFGRGCQLTDLRDPAAGDEMRVDLALQGPRSREILLGLDCGRETAERLRSLKWAGVMQGAFAGIDLVVTRTGYTGERTAFELFVHPEQSVELWKELLRVGEPMGLKPVGLGARDSLRTEAGLPLYGHEMAGDMDLGVGEAGFAAYVKTYKPWFVGREAFLAQEQAREREIARFRFDDKGVRMAHYGDPVVDKRGRVIGRVTSCAVDQEGHLVGQAVLKADHGQPGTKVAVFQGSPKRAGKPPADLEPGDRTTIPTPATVLSRFPS